MAFDVNLNAVEEVKSYGARGISNLQELVQSLETPRVIWILLKEVGVSYMGAGTSEGMEGARNGACYMIGGDPEGWTVVEPIFRDTAVENGYL